MEPEPVFDLAFAEVMKERLPVTILSKVVSDVFGKKDVAAVATIHYSLRYIDSRPSDVALIVYVGNSVDRSAVDAHPDLQAGTLLQLLADLERTFHRIFRCAKKEQRHSIAGRHTNEFFGCFSRLERMAAADDFVQLAQPLDLVVHQPPGVDDDVE